MCGGEAWRVLTGVAHRAATRRLSPDTVGLTKGGVSYPAWQISADAHTVLARSPRVPSLTGCAVVHAVPPGPAGCSQPVAFSASHSSMRTSGSSSERPRISSTRRMR